MKEGYVEKSKKADPQAMELINRFTRRELTADEVYTFSVILCDNEVDRDYERFSPEALRKLSGLYVGKTGIFDHQNKSGNQAARIYDCWAEEVEGRVTSQGEPYVRVVAQAYLPRGESNEGFILQLDAGIKKEVSVGCAVDSVRCSICGEEVKSGACRHQKGKKYGDKLCTYILDEPSDAYEWSFVAVPSQREAGVVKHFLSADKPAWNLAEEEGGALREKIRDLEERARAGDAYREELQREVVRLSGVLQPSLARGVAEGVAEKMTLDELKAFRTAYEKETEARFSTPAQLAHPKRGTDREGDQPFRI